MVMDIRKSLYNCHSDIMKCLMFSNIVEKIIRKEVCLNSCYEWVFRLECKRLIYSLKIQPIVQ